MHLINPLLLLRDAVLNGKSLLEKQVPTLIMDAIPFPTPLAPPLHPPTPNSSLFCEAHILKVLIRS